VIRIKKSQSQDPGEELYKIEKIWLIFTTFFSDVMIFTNAAGFLYLFKQMSDSKKMNIKNRKKNRKGANQEDIMDTLESIKSPILERDRTSDASKGTDYVRNIMENKSSANKTNTTLQYDYE
jgi:hypothetical protein